MKTGHPLCTEWNCYCEGDLPVDAVPYPRFIKAGHAVCMCHPAEAAENRGVERFECGKEATNV